MSFEIHTHGRDVYVRPTDDNWRTLKGSDGREWIELNADQARLLSWALSNTDRFTVTADDEDG